MSIVKPSHKQVQALALAHEQIDNNYPNVIIIKNTFHDDSKSVSVFGKSDDGREFNISGYQAVGGDCFGRTQNFLEVTSLAY